MDCRDSVLCANLKPTPIVFGDIRGEEISLVVSTAKGNENSKANREERDLAVRSPSQKVYFQFTCYCQSLVKTF